MHLSRIANLSIPCEIVLGGMQKTSLMISQHWFRKWLGATRQQAITSEPMLTQIYVIIWSN